MRVIIKTNNLFDKQFLWKRRYIMVEMLVLLAFILIQHQSTGMLIHMNEVHQKVFSNANITVTCSTEATNATGNLTLSVRARMFLLLLQIPRGGQTHQIQGVLHCDPKRTKCESEFNIAVDCITDRIEIKQPVDTLETACQLNDDVICSNQWLSEHREDCVALGKITIIKGPKLDEPCVHRNQSGDTLLPCGENQQCNTMYGRCECQPEFVPQKGKCEPMYVDDEDKRAQQLVTDLSGRPVTISYGAAHKPNAMRPVTTTASVLRPLPTTSDVDRDGAVEPTQTKTADTKNTSKALVIFLLVVAILLCIALAVVVIWSYSRNRNREAVPTNSS